MHWSIVFGANDHHTRGAGGIKKMRWLSAVSTRETDWVGRGRKDFWLIVSLSRSEDETEIRAGERTGDTSREEHPSRDAALIMLAQGKDALSPTNPYRGSRTQFGDIALGRT